MTTTKKLRELLLVPDESRLFRRLLVLSVAGHIFFFAIESIVSILNPPDPFIDEWSIESDLFSETDVGHVPQTTLPDAKVAEEAHVRDNMLPQLPKNYSFEEQKKAEDDDADLAEKVAKKGEAKPDQVEKAPDVDNVKDESNKIKMQDAMKRLALEKLKRDQKTKGKEIAAEKNDAIARIRDELKSGEVGQSIGGGGLGDSERRYAVSLRKAIQRHYALPQTFSSTVAELRVILAIIVDENGGLLSVKVHKSSNDEVFDDYSVRAAKEAAPFAKPPTSQVGQEIHVQFTR